MFQVQRKTNGNIHTVYNVWGDNFLIYDYIHNEFKYEDKNNFVSYNELNAGYDHNYYFENEWE